MTSTCRHSAPLEHAEFEFSDTSSLLARRPTNPEEAELKAALIRSLLPASQPQEGSPANTFTEAERLELQAAFPDAEIAKNLRPRTSAESANQSKLHKLDICGPWQPPEVDTVEDTSLVQETKQPEEQEHPLIAVEPLDWYGAPQFRSHDVHLPREFRSLVRQGLFTGPTNAQCPGFLQCNLVVLPAAQAFDFLLFCQRNPQSCPLIEVCEAGSPHPIGVAGGADLRTDVPK